MGQISLVIGATGLVGGQVTEELLKRPGMDEVRVLVRRPPDATHPSLRSIPVNWDELERFEEAFAGVHSVYCCLGTTIKKAGSREQFRKVDVEYVLKSATLARRHGVRQFLAVSSMGASPDVRNFYLRTKGEMEEGLTEMGFHGLHLFRPSLLLGKRPDSRFGEQAAAALMTSLDVLFRRPKLAPYRAVPSLKVARAMVRIGLTDMKGHHIYPNEVIHVLGDTAE